MNIEDLIGAAKKARGSLGAVADELGKPQSRISEWRKGSGKPSATDIMLMAEMADLPALETLADIESQLDAERASVWHRALGSLRAAGLAAAVCLSVALSLVAAPKPAHAEQPMAHCLHTAGVTGSIPVLPTRFMGM